MNITSIKSFNGIDYYVVECNFDGPLKNEVRVWCHDTFNQEDWFTVRRFYFYREQDAALFVLKWS